MSVCAYVCVTLYRACFIVQAVFFIYELRLTIRF